MKSPLWRHMLPWLLLLAIGLAASAVRFKLIESSAIGQLCSSDQAPWWCSLRTWLVLGFLHNIYGVIALIAIVPACLSGRTTLAWLAAALGALAVQLYCVEAGALALLIGSLRLLHLQARARGAPFEPYRQRQQQIQAKP